MPERVWLCLEALAACVEEDGTASSGIIDRLELEIKAFSPAKYLRTREHLNIAVGQLSRLAMRLKEHDPPR